MKLQAKLHVVNICAHKVINESVGCIFHLHLCTISLSFSLTIFFFIVNFYCRYIFFHFHKKMHSIVSPSLFISMSLFSLTPFISHHPFLFLLSLFSIIFHQKRREEREERGKIHFLDGWPCSLTKAYKMAWNLRQQIRREKLITNSDCSTFKAWHIMILIKFGVKISWARSSFHNSHSHGDWL